MQFGRISPQDTCEISSGAMEMDGSVERRVREVVGSAHWTGGLHSSMHALGGIILPGEDDMVKQIVLIEKCFTVE